MALVISRDRNRIESLKKNQASSFKLSLWSAVAAVFLQALREVVEAQGGMTRAVRLAGLNRESLYRQLSRRGTLGLASLNAILSTLGLKLRLAAG